MRPKDATIASRRHTDSSLVTNHCPEPSALRMSSPHRFPASCPLPPADLCRRYSRTAASSCSPFSSSSSSDCASSRLLTRTADSDDSDSDSESQGSCSRLRAYRNWVTSEVRSTTPCGRSEVRSLSRPAADQRSGQPRPRTDQRSGQPRPETGQRSGQPRPAADQRCQVSHGRWGLGE